MIISESGILFIVKLATIPWIRFLSEPVNFGMLVFTEFNNGNITKTVILTVIRAVKILIHFLSLYLPAFAVYFGTLVF